MTLLRRKLPSVIGVFALTAGLMVAGAATAAASNPPSFTCTGGTVPAGLWRSLTIAGACDLNNHGSTTIQRNVVLNPGSALDAQFGNLSVGHDVLAGSGSQLFMAGDVVFGNLVSNGATSVVVHDGGIAGEVAVNGGGAGSGCGPQTLGGTDFTTFEGVGIGGDVTVKDLRTCWAGINHNVINGTVNWNDNKAFIVEPFGADGNLVDANFIGHNLNCFDNTPAPHLSDFVPTKNTVGGLTRGQCVGLSQPVV